MMNNYRYTNCTFALTVRHVIKEQRRHENWQIKVCKRIAAETNFPNEEIIKLYLSDNNLVEGKTKKYGPTH
jgi:hypothetical protein